MADFYNLLFFRPISQTDRINAVTLAGRLIGHVIEDMAQMHAASGADDFRPLHSAALGLPPNVL